MVAKAAVPTDMHTEVLLKTECIIGFVMLKKISVGRIELKRLYWATAERGKGFGQHLLQFAVDFAQAHAFHWIQLETTSKFKPAAGLYE